MSQSNIIFGFLFAAFVIFITQRGELPIYLGFILAKPRAAGTATGTPVPGPGNITTAVLPAIAG